MPVSLFSSLFQHASSVKDVTIKIDDDSNYYSEKLNVEWSISKVRSQLLEFYKQNPYGRICFYKNMFFVNRLGAIISQDRENDYILNEILQDGNILKIKRDLKRPNELEIIEKCRLKYGIKISKDGLVQTQHEAFKFTNHDDIVELFSSDVGIHKNITRDTTHKAVNKKNLTVNAKIFTILPQSPLSVESMNYGETSTTDDIKVQGRAKVKLTSKEVEPSPKFKEAVENALKDSEPVKKLKEICETFGEFWAQEVILGGMIQTSINNAVENDKQTEEKTSEIGGSINVKTTGLNSELSLQYKKDENETTGSNSSETGTKSVYIGGNTSMARTNTEAWMESLEDYAKWRIIEYREAVSIFEILESDLREKVLQAFGEKILYAKIDQKDFRFTSNQNPCTHKLDIPQNLKKNLKNYQIYATVISENKGTFSVRVMYASDQSANLLIHRFRKYGKNQANKYRLTIRWIIVGIPSNFDHLGEEFAIKFSKHIPGDTLQETLRMCDEEDYPLVTCALKFDKDSLPYNPLDIKIVTGTHFHASDDNDEQLKICVCNYDLETCEIVKHLSLYTLYSQYCIISGTAKQQSVLNPENKYKKYPTWPCEQPTFASLYQQTHTEGCISGLLKIKSDE
ncbi:22195_t:CDS:2, partial [Gigaspora margarita]